MSTELGLVRLMLIVQLPNYSGRGRRGLVVGAMFLVCAVGEKLKEVFALNRLVVYSGIRPLLALLLVGAGWSKLVKVGLLVVAYGSGMW